MSEENLTERPEDADATPSMGGRDESESADVDPLSSLYASFRAEMAERSRKYDEYISTANYEVDLRRAYDSLEANVVFAPGDFVQWKTFMRESPLPEYGAPAVVVAVDGDFRQAKRAQEAFPKHDVLLAVLDGDQDFVTFSASSARLTRWESDGRPLTD